MTMPVIRQKILLIDDEERIRNILKAVLSEEGFEVFGAKDGAEGLQQVRTVAPDVVILDLKMPRMDGIETMIRLKELRPDTVAIMLTAHGSIQSAVEAMKQGAYDYLTKPFDNEQLLIVVRRAAEHARLSGELRDLRRQLGQMPTIEDLLGASETMAKTRGELYRLAKADATVLLRGESGTGKELAARAIHNSSGRHAGPFIVIDCTAIPSSLLESTFFGYERGAFTDAIERRTGKFEEANAGTAFLDEIGELPHEAQAKLLRVLQEHEFTRVGGTSPVRVDVRVITATNKDLAREVQEGRFREDLYYRLNVLQLVMPSLRSHPEDIPLLARHSIARHKSVLGSSVSEISDDALAILCRHRWPGNVRELENTIQRSMLLAHGSRIEASDLRESEWARESGDEQSGLEARVRQVTAEAERNIIVNALEKTGWNRTAAAEALNISRKTLFNKMQLYGISEETSSQRRTRG
ncbi:MAG: sigma-54 dependent transcriptional regulator [Bacteroidota bacterium]